MIKQLLIALGILLIVCAITSCQSSGLGNTCSKFGMTTQYVDVIALNHDVDGKGYIQTKFHCVPKIKLKSGK